MRLGICGVGSCMTSGGCINLIELYFIVLIDSIYLEDCYLNLLILGLVYPVNLLNTLSDLYYTKLLCFDLLS